MFTAPIIVVMILLAVVFSSIKIVNEYERGVVFRLGRVLPNEKQPGIRFVVPVLEKMWKISIRIVTMDIDPQDVITKDNVTLKVNAVVYFRVVAPIKAVVNIENYLYATSQLAQTQLRSILGEHTLDELLTNREHINTQIQSSLDNSTDPWGIKVEAVEVKHIDLPSDMQRAMAKEAESERERRAKVIAAHGEFEAAERLREAADLMEANPATMQLRYLQTLNDMSSESSSMIVFPLPIDIIKTFMQNKKS